MKKSLLFACLCGMVGASAAAFEAPKTEADVSWQAVSPNGQFLVSNLYGSLTIVDRATDKQYSFYEEGNESYALGIGNAVSNTGIVLCSNNTNYNASYWENGEWKEAPVQDATLTNSLNGITPDGSRIAGNIGGAPLSIDATATMQLPAVWDRNADGTYTLTALPHPDLDFIGRVPQYVTALCISDDGKTIVGQIRDFSGSFNEPIVYTQDAAGKWEYTLPMKSYFSVEGEIPADPGDGPSYPDVMSFLSDAGKAAYQEAMDKWAESGYQFELYPDVNDYLTDAEKAAFEAAVEKYNEDFAAWDEKYQVFQAFFDTLFETIPNFTFNNVCLKADGSKFSLTGNTEDDSDPMAWWPKTISTPWIIDTATGSVEVLDFGKSMAVTQILPDGTCLAFNGVNEVPATGYIIKDGECTDVYDYLCALDPEMKTWCDANLKHEMEEYDWETGETTFTEYTFTGMLLASDDMSVMTMWCVSAWNYDYITWGYTFNLEDYASVSNIEAGKSHIAFDSMGNLRVSDDIKSVNVYDLSGRLVLDGTAGGHLSDGIYLVRAQRADGSVISAKVRK